MEIKCDNIDCDNFGKYSNARRKMHPNGIIELYVLECCGTPYYKTMVDAVIAVQNPILR